MWSEAFIKVVVALGQRTRRQVLSLRWQLTFVNYYHSPVARVCLRLRGIWVTCRHRGVQCHLWYWFWYIAAMSAQARLMHASTSTATCSCHARQRQAGLLPKSQVWGPL